VIAGERRGFPLRAPHRAGTRPTSDKVREAIFSMLMSMGAEMDRVLDLYAGAGALAIEALSRGAGSAVLVDRAPAACAAIRDNLAKTGYTHRARLIRGEVERVLPHLEGPFDLVFLDPPYAEARVPGVLEALADRGLLSESATVVYEHSKRTDPPERCGPLGLYLTRRHGDTSVSIYDREPVEED
jgi:16S rRNA (guanine966-N2)-methyltransferase